MLKVSFLIPAYNYDCFRLVHDLHVLLEEHFVGLRAGERNDGIPLAPYEILLAEDGSTDPHCLAANSRVEELTQVRYLTPKVNVGRSAIRNLLADEARGEWLVFIDCDARVEDPLFVNRYLAVFEREDADVVVGGLYHPDQCPSPAVILRYKYEKNADRFRAARFREELPYGHFSTFNFAIRRDAFMQVRFDEQCREYGYEDTLFGVELERQGFRIRHIDNPLLHLGLEPNEVFLRKSETALRTLRMLGEKMVQKSHVGRAAERIRRWHLVPFSRFLFSVSRGWMRRNLLSRHPNLLIFSLYKLGYFLSLK